MMQVGPLQYVWGTQLFKTYPRGGDGSKKEVQTMAKVWKSQGPSKVIVFVEAKIFLMNVLMITNFVE